MLNSNPVKTVSSQTQAAHISMEKEFLHFQSDNLGPVPSPLLLQSKGSHPMCEDCCEPCEILRAPPPYPHAPSSTNLQLRVHSAGQVPICRAWEVHTAQDPVDVHLKGGKGHACVEVGCGRLSISPFSRSQPSPQTRFTTSYCGVSPWLKSSMKSRMDATRVLICENRSARSTP